MDVVDGLARRRLGEDSLRVLPQTELLVAILEFDPEGAREDREVVLDGDRAFRLEAADEPLAAVIDRRQDLGAASARPTDLVADQRVPDRLTELGLDVGGAESPEPRLRLDRDEAEPWHGLEQTARCGALAKTRRALRVVVQGDRLVDPVRELHRREAVGQELRRVAHREPPRELLDLVVEEHARRTPHDDLFRLVALEKLDRALVHAAGRRGVAVPVMNDAAAVRWAADRDVVEAEPIGDGGDRANHVRGAQDVAAEVEHDLVRLSVALGRGQTPRALLGQGRQVLGERDLAEVLLVVVGHLRSPVYAALARAAAGRPASPCPWSSPARSR